MPRNRLLVYVLLELGKSVLFLVKFGGIELRKSVFFFSKVWRNRVRKICVVVVSKIWETLCYF